MAFAQKHRRPVPRYQNPIVSEEFLSSNESSLSSHNQIVSDSDNDWHVIGAAVPSPSSPSSTQSCRSPLLVASETESLSSFRPSDSGSDSFSDIGNHIIHSYNFNALPSHDGTGIFLEHSIDTPDSPQDDLDSSGSYHRVVQQLFLDPSSQEQESQPSNNSVANILLPYAGLEPPSFARGYPTQVNDSPPAFAPTVTRENTQNMMKSNGYMSCEEDAVLQQDSTMLSDESTSSAYSRFNDNNMKFTSKTQKNLDSIPAHHPGLPGASTSSAILSVVWNSVRRLTNHLIENDTNTVETLSTIMSEAVFEGYLPFGSHLHMDIGGGIRTSYHTSLLEVE